MCDEKTSSDPATDPGLRQYIGTKIVDAKPMSLHQFIDYNSSKNGSEFVSHKDENAPGYMVVYEDGYVSWSPMKAFEDACRRTDAMNFGLAIEAMKKGHRVCRAGWNGKDMFIFERQGFTANQGENTYDNRYGAGVQKFLLDQPSVTFTSVLCMFTAQRTVVTGWLASQTDMLADDWVLVE